MCDELATALASQKELMAVKFWACDIEDAEVDAIMERLLPVTSLADMNLGDNPLTMEKKEALRAKAKEQRPDLKLALF